MADVSQWDPQFVAGRAYDLWYQLDRSGTWKMSLDEAERWQRLGVELLELKSRLEWLGLYRTPGGAS